MAYLKSLMSWAVKRAGMSISSKRIPCLFQHWPCPRWWWGWRYKFFSFKIYAWSTNYQTGYSNYSQCPNIPLLFVSWVYLYIWLSQIADFMITSILMSTIQQSTGMQIIANAYRWLRQTSMSKCISISTYSTFPLKYPLRNPTITLIMLRWICNIAKQQLLPHTQLIHV